MRVIGGFGQRFGRGLVRASVGLLVFGPVAAQQVAPSATSESFVDAKPIERVAPNYPYFAVQDRKEGWVMLSFVISPNGEVTEPMIEDSSGNEAFEAAALDAVKNWRYSPATRDGVPVEQSIRKSRITFRLEEAEKGATSAFLRKYREVQKFLNDRDLPMAATLLDAMESGERTNLYEDAWFWWLKFLYLKAAKPDDVAGQRDALRIALGYEEDYLPPDVFVAAARELYVLEINGKDFGAARRVFLRLRDSKTAQRSKSYAEALATLTPHFARVQQVIDGHETLNSLATIGRYEYWVHDLMRRSFSIADVKGRLEFVEIRCARGTRRYDSFTPDDVWTIPASWGDCGVYIKGNRGASFVFEEHPPQSAVEGR